MHYRSSSPTTCEPSLDFSMQHYLCNLLSVVKIFFSFMFCRNQTNTLDQNSEIALHEFKASQCSPISLQEYDT